VETLSKESVEVPEPAALVAAEPEAPVPETEPVARIAPLPVFMRGRARRMKLVLLAAAATLTLVVGAFASTEAGRRAMAPYFLGREGNTTPYGEATPATVTAGHPAALRPSTPVAAAPPPGTIEAPPATLDLAPPPSAGTAVAAAPPPAVLPPAVTAVAPPPVAAPPEGPAPLFGAETDARRRGDTARMLELHAQLVARFPGSHEAQVSRMMVARLLLDRGDAAGALSGFDAYLRAGGGELREDALAGRATALERMGRTGDARRAWMALLDQYPNTAYGAHARSQVEATSQN
jgi:TolA-binding protein